MRLGKRLVKVQQALQARGRADQFDMIDAVPVGDEYAEGRPPGLYRDGPEGSTVGTLVFEPGRTEPVVPPGRLAPWCLVILHGPEYVEPPLTDPEMIEVTEV